MAVFEQLIIAVVLVILEVSFSTCSYDKTCGEKTCRQYEYCSDFICTNCSLICHQQSHNFDRSTCNSYCQDYINDFVLGFVRRSEVEGMINEAVLKSYLLGLVSLCLSILVIFFIIGFLLYVWVQYRRRKIVSSDKTIKKMQSVHNVFDRYVAIFISVFCLEMLGQAVTVLKTICNNNSAIDGVDNVNRLHLKMPSPSVDHKDTQSEVTTTTPLSTRYPTEDVTLEYAYDNPVLTHSPTSFKETSPPRPRTETSF